MVKTKEEQARYYKIWSAKRTPEQIANCIRINKISARRYYLKNRAKIIKNSREYSLNQKKLYPNNPPYKRKPRDTYKSSNVVNDTYNTNVYYLKKTSIVKIICKNII